MMSHLRLIAGSRSDAKRVKRRHRSMPIFVPMEVIDCRPDLHELLREHHAWQRSRNRLAIAMKITLASILAGLVAAVLLVQL